MINVAGASMSLEGYEYMGCYRDQVEPRLLRGEMLDFPETLTPSLCVETVSYTHLDVYKRQVCECVRAYVCIISYVKTYDSMFTSSNYL